MRLPVLFAGLIAMLLSFLAGVNFFLFITAAIVLILVFVSVFFLKKNGLHFIFVAFVVLMVTVAAVVNVSAITRVNGYSGKTENITAVITETPTYNGVGYSYTAKLKTINYKKVNFTKICINSYKDTFEVGDLVEAQVTFFGFDNKNSFYSQNIYIGSTLKNVIDVKHQYNSLRYKIYKLQQYTNGTITNYLHGDTGQLIVGVITGERSEISDETYDLIKQSGVTHMVVVSGMHLSIVCAIVIWLFSKIIPNRYAQTFATLAVIIFIMLFCGFTKSILRAGITYIILTLAPLFKRDSDSLSALAFTVISVVFISPYSFYSISFQLTLSSTFGILVLSPIISKKLNTFFRTENIGWIRKCIDFLCVTIGANIMTLPIVLYTFGWISVVSLATNVLINYAVSTALVVGIIGVVIGKITVIAYPCFFIAGMLSKYSLWVIKTLGSLPYATVSFNGKTLAVIVCMIYLVIYVFYSLIDKNVKENLNGKL